MAVPAAPVITARNTGDSSIKIAWEAVALATATGYKLYRDLVSPATTLRDGTLGVVTYTFDAGSNGIQYFYRLKATNGDGDSAFSNEVRVLCANSPTETPTQANRHNRRF